MEENGNLVQFIFNMEREVVSEDGASGLNRLIRGTELIARSCDSARTYYHYASDEMGSTTHIVDEAGAVQNRYAYDAWGNVVEREETVENRFTYYGQQFDPITQQYYLRARFYNPAIARFTQEDVHRGDGLNLYAYCRNNPVFYTNPSGNACGYKDPLNPERLPNIGNNRSMTREQWKAAYSQARAEANHLSKLTYIGNKTWRSPKGLIYERGSKEGNRVRHVFTHTRPSSNPHKKKHSIFNVKPSKVIGLVDEAWSRRGCVVGNPQSNGNTPYIIPMGRRVGTLGETHIMIIVRTGTSEIQTAYPIF